MDVRSVAAERRSGVENYALAVATEVPPLADEHRFLLFVDPLASDAAIRSLRAPNVQVVRVPTADARLFPLALAAHAVLRRIDLFHFPVGMLASRFPARRTVTNIHDLTFLVHPEFYDPIDLRNQHRAVARARRATAVIAISENTRTDLVERAGFDARRVHVTPLEPRASLPAGAARAPGFAFPYALCVGNVQPRKNFLGAVQALSHIPDLHLVIVGKGQDDAYRARVDAEVERLALRDRVHWLGYVEDDVLAGLYDAAALLLFPSIYEGFGYPIVEAFARGVPVVTSDASCMPETAGDAAEFCSPGDPASIGAAVRTALGRRDELAAAGRRRLAALTSPSLAERTLDVYRALL